MNSSAYYYDLAMKNLGYEDDYRELISMYNGYYLSLKMLKDYMSGVYTYLVMSEKQFKNGGWVSAGDVLEQEKLKNTYEASEEVVIEITTLIEQHESKLEEYRSKRAECHELYEENMRNYRNALALEASMSEGTSR